MSVAHTWGTTAEERALPWPCDDFVAHADGVCWRGITVRADPATVFRWLCQLQVAPYSYDWIDNRGRQSPRALTPGADDLAIGQRMMSIFELVAFERDRHLTLVTRRFASRVLPAVAVTYAVVPLGPRETRLLVKLVFEARPGLLGGVAKALLPWGDLVMMRKQLLNLKELAEGSGSRSSGSPAAAGPPGRQSSPLDRSG